MSETNRVSWREYLDIRFDALEAKLEMLKDHESRIRSLEKERPFRTIIETITAIVAAIATVLGLRQP